MILPPLNANGESRLGVCVLERKMFLFRGR